MSSAKFGVIFRRSRQGASFREQSVIISRGLSLFRIEFPAASKIFSFSVVALHLSGIVPLLGELIKERMGNS